MGVRGQVKMFLRFLIVFIFLLPPHLAAADGFLDWWLTPDQQGRLHFQRGDYLKSARKFEISNWKATAFYRAGDFANAAALFANDKSPEGYFLLGNALAKQEKLAPAIEAYENALELKPDFEEAAFNLRWVEGLLKLSQKEYDDAGGTDGKLGADRIVVDERGAKGKGETSAQELQAQSGLSDEQIHDMWMRRVQTTPGEFLAYKFRYQLSTGDTAGKVDQQ